MDGVFYLATSNGLEPSTSSVTGWRANRLHHEAMCFGTREIIADDLGFVKSFFKKIEKICEKQNDWMHILQIRLTVVCLFAIILIIIYVR